MAYLPRCDVGVVLMDAASTLTPDDLKIIQALSNASVPVTVLLSKADFLNDADRQRVQKYVHDQVFVELAMDVVVYPVSIIPSHKRLLDAWLREDLASLYSRQQELRHESICRKILALRDSVCAALEADLRAVTEPGEDPANLQNIESRLRSSSGVLQGIEPELRRMTEQVSKLAPAIIWKAADLAALRWAAERRLDLGEVLWTTAAQATAELADQLHTTLEQAGASLRLELLNAAVALRAPDAPSTSEISTNREMPGFSMNRELLLVSKYILGDLFGHGTLRRHAEKKFKTLRPALEQALNSYSRLLRGWGERTLIAVERQFNIYADQYRAQLDRRLSGRQTSDGDVSRLNSDLALLTELIIRATGPDTRAQAS
jgi:hypothetical protein